MIGYCTFCGELVPERQAAFPVTGWEVLRAQGGANRILGRERVPNVVAHARCAEREIERKRLGIAEGQGRLI